MIREYPHTAFASRMTNKSDASQNAKHDALHMDHFGRPQPVIGIPIPVTQGAQGLILFADAAGAWAVERMLGRVFLIPLWPFPTHQHVYQSLWPLLQSMDGLFLPAGLQESNWYTHWKNHERRPGPQSWSISWKSPSRNWRPSSECLSSRSPMALKNGIVHWEGAKKSRRQRAYKCL